MKKIKKVKLELWMSVVFALAFIVLSVHYLIDILKGDAERLIIISFIIYLISAGAWTMKAVADNKRLKELKKD